MKLIKTNGKEEPWRRIAVRWKGQNTWFDFLSKKRLPAEWFLKHMANHFNRQGLFERYDFVLQVRTAIDCGEKYMWKDEKRIYLGSF